MVEKDVVRQGVLQSQPGLVQLREQAEVEKHGVLVHVRRPLIGIRDDQFAMFQVAVVEQHGLDDSTSSQVRVQVRAVQHDHPQLVVCPDAAVNGVAQVVDFAVLVEAEQRLQAFASAKPTSVSSMTKSAPFKIRSQRNSMNGSRPGK